MEAVCISETAVHSNETTWLYIPEDSKLHTRRRENLKSHKAECSVQLQVLQRADRSFKEYYQIFEIFIILELILNMERQRA
jgi:hypothetical protein